ncbi:MAG: hypothetical protein J07HX64_00719 [halophilic archaeon J07HX64]|jgi:hypothetical protein|nr:MAG: hypothetical protein J07HX64_00719 [halophilic archaeon J07HX64]
MATNTNNRSLLTVAVVVGVVMVLTAGAAAMTQTQTQSGVVAHEQPTEDPGGPDNDTDDEFEPPRDGDDDIDDEFEPPGGPDGDDNKTTATVTGVLEQATGEDYRLDGLAIDIGAMWYTNSTEADTDLDGDGTVETIRAEFDGLVGQSVTVTVETDGIEGDVLAVNGEQYREQGPPPWAGGPHGNGPPDHAGP